MFHDKHLHKILHSMLIFSQKISYFIPYSTWISLQIGCVYYTKKVNKTKLLDENTYLSTVPKQSNCWFNCNGLTVMTETLCDKRILKRKSIHVLHRYMCSY